MQKRLVATGLLPLLLLLTLGSCASATPRRDSPGSAPASFAVLFVGNSLTFYNDMPLMLRELLERHGEVGPVHLEVVAVPNFGLPDHWRQGTARARIALGGWDVVVLQQGPSATEGRPYLLAYAERFAAEIEAAGARTALYMVWPSRARFSDFDGVSDSYATAAERVDGLLFPVGEAWRAAWARDPDLALYGPDGFHPSAIGSYLAALVMYEQLAGRDPRELPAEIPTDSGSLRLAPEVADRLGEAAVEANERFARREPKDGELHLRRER